MTQKMMQQVSKILGVGTESIAEMPEEILTSMQTVLENVEIQNEEDKQILCEDLDSYWVKGTVLLSLAEAAKNTGISYETLKSLDFDTQQNIVFEYMADSKDTERIYAIVNKALSVHELKSVALLLSVSESELHMLPDAVQEQLCGMYAMEYEEGQDNSALIASLKALVQV